MDVTIEENLARLRKIFGAANDAELARALKLGQSTISTWKSRGRIPDRVLSILDGKSPLALGTSPMNWGPHENAALGLALVRLCRIHAADLLAGDFRSALEMANRPSDLWTLFRRSQQDIADEMNRMDEGHHHPALSLIIHDKSTHPEEASRAARETILNGRSSIEFSDGTVAKL